MADYQQRHYSVQERAMGGPQMGSHDHPQHRRAKSVPSSFGTTRPKPSIRVKTLNESLHTTWESSQSKPKNVYWSEVKIRQYERTIGDNPSCSSGPPLSIGWQFDPRPTVMSVDGYERLRPPRKSQFEMVVPREERQDILIDEWRIPQGVIAGAVRKNILAKNQRRKTVNNLGKMTKFEEMTESIGRKFKRAIAFQKRPGAQAAVIMAQHEAAVAQREAMWGSQPGPSQNGGSQFGSSQLGGSQNGGQAAPRRKSNNKKPKAEQPNHQEMNQGRSQEMNSHQGRPQQQMNPHQGRPQQQMNPQQGRPQQQMNPQQGRPQQQMNPQQGRPQQNRPPPNQSRPPPQQQQQQPSRPQYNQQQQQQQPRQQQQAPPPPQRPPPPKAAEPSKADQMNMDLYNDDEDARWARMEEEVRRNRMRRGQS